MRAELHGKTADGEDGLTAAVFSALAWLPATAGLLPVLQVAFPHESWTGGDADVELVFWPRFQDGTEPDVVILTRTHAVVVETKAGATFGEQQLERERSGLAAYFPARRRRQLVLTVTSDAFQPPQVDAFEASLDEPTMCAWLSWSAIATLLRESAAELTVPQQRLVNDLLAFLRHRGVHMDYTGITPEDNWTLAAATRAAAERVYPQIAALQSALLARLRHEGIVWGDNQRRVLWLGSRSLDYSQQWGVNFLMLPYRDATWPAGSDPTLTVVFDFYRARMLAGARTSWPSASDDQEARLNALSGTAGWRAVVGNWNIAGHAHDLPAETLGLEDAAEQLNHSAATATGTARLWVYKARPMHDAPLDWIATTLLLTRDFVTGSPLMQDTPPEAPTESATSD